MMSLSGSQAADSQLTMSWRTEASSRIGPRAPKGSWAEASGG
jgi:hypothetical protein